MDDPAPLVLSAEEIAYLVAKAGNGGMAMSSRATAVAIALQESGGNTYAHNAVPPDDSYGLWQINMRGQMGDDRLKAYGLQRREDLYVATINADIMENISSGGGDFRAWSTFKNKSYLVHMPAATTAVSTVGPAVIGGAPNEQFNPATRLKQSDKSRAEADANPLDKLLLWIREQMLRAAGFVGGGVLVIVAIVLYVRSQK